MQIGGRGLLARALDDVELRRLLARGRKLRAPFAVAPVEHQNLAARLQPQHIEQIVRLRRRPAAQLAPSASAASTNSLGERKS